MLELGASAEYLSWVLELELDRCFFGHHMSERPALKVQGDQVYWPHPLPHHREWQSRGGLMPAVLRADVGPEPRTADFSGP